MNDEIVIRNPDSAPHESTGVVLIEQAKQIIVTNNDERSLAGAFEGMLDEQIKTIEREFNGNDSEPGPVTLAHRAWKAGVALREKALKARVEAKAIVRGVIRKFEFDQEQKRLAEARRLEDEARKKAEGDRKKEIERARKIGDKEAVEQLKTAPLNLVMDAPSTQEVPSGGGMRKSSPIWAWEMVNVSLLPDDLWEPNEKEITARVKRLGPKAGIPGVAVYDARSRGE